MAGRLVGKQHHHQQSMHVPAASWLPPPSVHPLFTPPPYLHLAFERQHRRLSWHLQVEVAQLQRLDGDVQHDVEGRRKMCSTPKADDGDLPAAQALRCCTTRRAVS